LGLKGAMSEAELHVLKARLRGGILNKVRRGEYRCVLPTGLLYDEAGSVVLDPDSQVREAIAYFFETFSRVGSAHQTVKVFRKEGLGFPSRFRTLGSQVVFRPLTASTAMRTLTNPRYAGVYAYGRRRYRRTAEGQKIHRKRERNDWLACLPNTHPGYITWDRYQENLKLLEANGRGYAVARASPPREGSALLQGRAVCGRCGRHFRVRYAARRGRRESWYICDRASGQGAESNCQSIAGPPIDEAIGQLVAERMTPAAVELALEIRREVEARQGEVEQLRLRAVQRAQVEADLAQRRFMLVDPSNRLVADTLEAEWNDKLRALASLREERERERRDAPAGLDETTCKRLVAMTSDFKQLWAEPATPNRERKRMVAHILEDVTLVKLPREGTTTIHVRFKGGKTETLSTRNPKSSAHQVKTQPEVVALVDKLLDEHVYSEIADLLNQQGLRPGGSVRPGRKDAPFTAKRVAYLALSYGLRSRYDRLRDRGHLTKEEMAARLGIHEQTLVRWAKHGLVKAHAYNGHAVLYEAPGPNPPVKQCSRWNRLIDRAATTERAEASQTTHVEPEEV
ncbi:recombinase family protein, partial [Corallococcus exiguus]|nr:recombinase family protein [Corallococcus exiguus]